MIHCSNELPGFLSDKSAILVHHSIVEGTYLLWIYAFVLGIFHARVTPPDRSERRMEFLFVRWTEPDPDWVAGPKTRRLDRVQLCAPDNSEAVGFVDPASVIHGCQLIPAFRYGQMSGDYVGRAVGGDLSTIMLTGEHHCDLHFYSQYAIADGTFYTDLLIVTLTLGILD